MEIKLREGQAREDKIKDEIKDLKVFIEQQTGSVSTLQHSLQAKSQEIDILTLDLANQKQITASLQDKLQSMQSSTKDA